MSRLTLLPSLAAEAPEDVLDRLFAAPRLMPFDDVLVETLAALSRAILSAPDLARRAEAVALGFWLRPANLARLARQFRAAYQAQRLRVPAGLAFHIPPANVDTIFAYSWALGLLCGNFSLVRLSQRSSPLMLRLVELIAATLQERPAVAAGSAFVTYGRDDAITAAISARADLRIVWGGDASVAAIRAVPLSPLAREIVFADRLSLAILDAAAWLALPPAERAALAKRAYGDIFSFDQMACSSPRLLVWRGPREAVDQAALDFDRAMRDELDARGYKVAPATALEKYAESCRASIDWPVASVRRERLDWLVIDLGDARPRPLPAAAVGAGTVVQLRIDSLEQLVTLVDRRVQTICHFGLLATEIEGFARALAGRGGDRIVPLGEALAFSETWDGNDLLLSFTRLVELR
jgi:hypothetical protein